MANTRQVGQVTRIAGAIALACAIGAVVLVVRSHGGSGAHAAAKSQAAPAMPQQKPGEVGLVEAPRDVRYDADPPGIMRIEGQVVTDDLAPVAGAVVTITTVPPRTVTTEADGAFAFENLPPRQFGLIATSDKGVAGPVPARPRETRDPVLLKVQPAASLDVVVLRAADHKPVAGAAVAAVGLVTFRATTDDAGHAHLTGMAPGKYEVAAGAAQLAPSRADVFLSGAGAAHNVELQLARGAAVSGRVVANGKPVEGAKVAIVDDLAGEHHDPTTGPILTSHDGTFAIAAVPRGSFRLVATTDTFAPGELSLSADGTTPRTNLEIALVPGATLAGTVVAANGAPVSGALVRVGRRDAAGPGRAARQATTDEKGHFALGGLAAGEMLVAATADRASSPPTTVAMKAGAKTDLELKLVRAGRIAGVVVDRNGTPLEAAMVRMWRDPHDASPAPEAALWGFPIELTDANGHFEVTGLATGRYVLEAAPPGAIPKRRVSRKTWNAVTDGQDLRLVVEKDGSLHGRVVYEDGTAPEKFTVRAGGSDARGAGGRAEFELADIAPGTVAVTVEGPGFATHTVPDVTVTSGQAKDLGTITVARGSGRRLAGHVVTPDGKPVADAIVRAGHMLVGDGSSSNSMFAPTGANAPRDTTTDESGAFVLYGVARGDIAIVAEHDVLGRSSTMSVRTGDESLPDLRIVILPFGKIEGVVIKDHKPASKVLVQATPTASPESVFGVLTDNDGKFHFDRLAPDDYHVSAVVGSPDTGFSSHTKSVKVTQERTASVTIEVESTGVTVEVRIAPRNALSTGVVWVDAVAADITPKTGRDLKLAMTTLGEASNHQGMSMDGAPAKLADLAPGHFTLCAMAYPLELKEMSQVMDYLTREGDQMAVNCMPLQVSPSSGVQSVQIAVDVPAYIPPPKDPPQK